MPNSVFQMDDRKTKLSQFIFTELFFYDDVDLVFSEKSLARWQLGSRKKALPNKALEINLTSFVACWKNHKGINVLICFSSKAIYFQSDVNIPAKHYMHPECRLIVNISQSHFCINFLESNG